MTITGDAQRTISSTAVGGDAVEVGDPARLLLGELRQSVYAPADCGSRSFIGAHHE
jgi:hypothetical protein